MRFAVDEDFDNRILRGLLRRLPKLDIVRTQDVGLLGKDDPAVLDWAAAEDRILLTHDASTMTRFVYARIESGRGTPGVFEVPQGLPIGEPPLGCDLQHAGRIQGSDPLHSSPLRSVYLVSSL